MTKSARDFDHLDARLWAAVTATVRPFPGRSVPKKLEIDEKEEPPARPAPVFRAAKSVAKVEEPKHHVVRPPQPIEPRRRRRLEIEREDLAGRLDLHGLDQDRARAVLSQCVLRAHAAGRRAILVITGKGALGAGVLRRRVPEWLAEPPLRAIVAGVSEAHRRHGGEGALYVAIKRHHHR